MNSPSRSTVSSTIACTTCARLKTKCDRKIPCGRCVARNVTCDPRQVRRWANFESGSAKTASQHPPNPEHRRPATPKRGNAQAENTEQTSLWGPSSTQEGARDPSKIATESIPTFDLDTFQNDLSSSGTENGAGTLQFNTSQQPQPLGLCFTPDFPIQDGLSSSNEDILMMDKFQSFVSTYTHNDLDFDISMLSDEQFFQAPYLSQSAVISEPATSLGSLSNTTMSGDLNSNGIAVLPATTNSYGMPPFAQPASHKDLPKLQTEVQDHEAVLVSRKHWSSFNCIPPEVNAKCPRTAGIYLEGLLQALSNHDLQFVSPDRANADITTAESSVEVVAISNHTRDKLLVCTQALLQKALQSHRNQPSMRAQDSVSSFHHLRGANDAFIVLPASSMLDSYIRTYACRFEQNYPLIPAGELEINTIMQLSDPRAPALLLLLMIALGSKNHSDPHVQYLASGLTEVCRIGVFDACERSVDTQWDMCSLRSGLLFTLLAAWSGDKWHMDVAVAHRGTNTSLLRQAKLLTYRVLDLATLEAQSGEKTCWEAWKVHESRNRLLYSWVTLDLEISVFHDVAPVFSVNELCAVLPQDDNLWQARTSSDWSALQKQAAHAQLNLSLSELFGTYIQNGSPESLQLTSLHLRLLLYPIQSLVYNIQQFRSCVIFEGSSRTVPRPSSKSRVSTRLGEAQTLLLQWYNLHRLHIERTASNTQHDTKITINLILYHLISLDSSVCFRCIEQLGYTVLTRKFWGRQGHCIEDAEETWIHCGQILRLLRRIPEGLRPAWYSAAVYRVALISYANSLFLSESSALHTPTSSFASLSTLGNSGGVDAANTIRNTESATVFAIDTLLPEDSRLEQYQKYGEGTPMLRRRSGTFIRTTDAQGVLAVCMELLDESDKTPFTAGIRERLGHVAKQRPARKSSMSWSAGLA